ncbi:MAG TPA: 4-vinyl reductase [Nitrososphaerales archaeon]|nr:4-vinyl reductase [Nitrososphaerales archaeon]
MPSPDTITFRYDPEKEILENAVLNTRVLVFDADFIKALTDSLTKTFQSGAVVIIYQMGLAYGELLGRRIVESGGLSKQAEGVYRARYASLAAGKFRFPPLAALASAGPQQQVRVTLEDSFFARAIGRTGKPECHIVRGLLEGTANVVFGRDYACQETRCLSKGDDLCEFLVVPRAQARNESPRE